MPTLATINSLVGYGLAQAAAALGAPCAWYRCSGAGPAISPATSLGTIQASITADAEYRKVSDYKKPQEWRAYLDITQVQAGDYLVDPSKPTDPTFFVAAVEDFRMPRLVRCTRVLTVRRPGEPSPGADYYGGARDGNETVILTGWPAGCEGGGKGEASDTRLPGDTRMPGSVLYLPATSGVQIRNGDYVTDTQPLPMTYIVLDAEPTALGWRLSCAMAQS